MFNDPRKTKPLPVTAIDGTCIYTPEDLDQWFSSWNEASPGIYYNDFTASVAQWDFIFDNKIQEWLMRYKLHSENKINSYSNLFDEIPVKWLDVISYMKDIYNIALQELAKEKKIYGN